MQASNTPPDGDFVRYVELLSLARQNALLLSNRSLPDITAQGHDSAKKNHGEAVQPVSATKLENTFSMPSLLKPLRWLVLLWVATQVLSKWLPGAGFLFLPLLLAGAAWWFFKSKGGALHALVERLKDHAESVRQQNQAPMPGSVSAKPPKHYK